MQTNTVEIRALANFVLACQNPTIGETARQLGVSPSTLSAGLHALEASLDLRLFHRQGAYLAPLPAAFWLFQVATSVLHAESLACTSMTGAPPASQVRILLDLSFNIGRFSKAVSRTVEAMRRKLPGTHFDFTFCEEGEEPGAGEGPDAAATILVRYASADTRTAATVLHEDAWVTVGHVEGSSHPGDEKLVVPRIRQTLMESLRAHAARHGFQDRLVLGGPAPAEIGTLLNHAPNLRFVVPRSMLSERMGLGHQHVTPLDPPLATPIVATITGSDPTPSEAFIEELRKELIAPEANAVFRPVLTARQVRYFNLVRQSGGIAAAARAAHVSQPTVSQQIRRMEAALGLELLSRTTAGAGLTGAGETLAPLSEAIEARLDRIASQVRDVAASTQSAVTLGLLPSSGHDSDMTGRVASALVDLRAKFPGSRVRVVERSNAALHDGIKTGELNLAVVGSAQAQFPRAQLGPSERLSVIAHPDLGLDSRETIPIAEAVALPLALGPRQLSIHAAFVEAAEKRHLSVNVVLALESLPLTIAMMRLAPLATVLPASSVREDVASGRLTATLIDEPLSSGTLSVVFSGDRSLSEIERAMVRALANAFAVHSR